MTTKIKRTLAAALAAITMSTAMVSTAVAITYPNDTRERTCTVIGGHNMQYGGNGTGFTSLNGNAYMATTTTISTSGTISNNYSWITNYSSVSRMLYIKTEIISATSSTVLSSDTNYSVKGNGYSVNAMTSCSSRTPVNIVSTGILYNTTSMSYGGANCTMTDIIYVRY